MVRLRIEEDNRLALKKGFNADSSKVNVVEVGQTSKTKGKGAWKGKGEAKNLGPKSGTFKKKKFKCYNCGDPNHKASECPKPRRDDNRQANMVNNDVEFVALIT